MAHKKIFIDSDIILDLLLDREPFSAFAQDIFSLPQNIRKYTSTVIIINTYYFTAKRNGKAAAIEIIKELLKEISLLAVGPDDIELSLTNKFTDFEDGIQYSVARKNNCEAIITRNLADYKKSSVPVMTAEQYLKSL